MKRAKENFPSRESDIRRIRSSPSSAMHFVVVAFLLRLTNQQDPREREIVVYKHSWIKKN